MKLESHISCFRECKRVRGNEPSHSQGSSHFGSWNFGGLQNFKRAIVGSKPIELKSSLYHWKARGI